MSRGGRTERVLVGRFDGAALRREPDDLIVEEPLTIQLDGVTVATTMRTPGNDFELAVGFCSTEGLLDGAAVTTVRYCGDTSAAAREFNVVDVRTDGAGPTPELRRITTTSSSCGLCGAESIDELRDRVRPLRGATPIPLEILAKVPDAVRADQPLFDTTGSVHAAARFGLDGTVLLGREDIGRHNAVDKVVGRLHLDGVLPASTSGLYVSGRASFEIVSKAWAAGFSAVVSVSGPSALAVSAARAGNLTLAGFARDGRLNAYHQAG